MPWILLSDRNLRKEMTRAVRTTDDKPMEPEVRSHLGNETSACTQHNLLTPLSSRMFKVLLDQLASIAQTVCRSILLRGLHEAGYLRDHFIQQIPTAYIPGDSVS